MKTTRSQTDKLCGVCSRRRIAAAGQGEFGASSLSRSAVVLLLTMVLCALCARDSTGPADTGEDAQVTSRGTIEVTAKLEEIPEGAIFQRDLYNYATVLRYQIQKVHRGQVAGSTILVAHYNPFKPRAEAADQRVADIGGNLRTFRAGQLHRLALEVPVDDYYMGGIVNKYFGQDTGPIHWAVWTNLASG